MNKLLPVETYIFPDGEIIEEPKYTIAYNGCYGTLLIFTDSLWISYLEPIPTTGWHTFEFFRWVRISKKHYATNEQKTALLILGYSYG